MGNLNRKYMVLAAKAEAVEGTAETLTATEGKLEVYDFKYDPQPEFNQRPAMRNTLTQLPSVRGGGAMEFSFRFPLKGSDTTADSIPVWDPLMVAAQFKQTVNVGTDVTYTPNDSPPGASITMGVYIDGTSLKIRGARCTAWKLVWNPTTFPVVECAFRGILVGTGFTDTAILAPTYPSTQPQVVHAGAMTLDGLALTASEVSIEANIQSTLKYEAGKEHGLLSVWTSRNGYTMAVNPELELAATKAWLKKMMENTVMAFAAVVGSGSTGEQIDLAADQFKAEAHGDAEREALSLVELSGPLTGLPTGTADEFSIVKS